MQTCLSVELCLCLCIGVAEILQGHKAAMCEKIKCGCAASPGHSSTNFHCFVLESGWITSDKPDQGLKIFSLLGVEK